MSSTTTIELDQAVPKPDQSLRSRSRSGSQQPVPVLPTREAREEIEFDENPHISEGHMVNIYEPTWPTEYRRVPARRPVNPDLDRAERPSGANGLEHIVISVMLQGVQLQSVSKLPVVSR